MQPNAPSDSLMQSVPETVLKFSVCMFHLDFSIHSYYVQASGRYIVAACISICWLPYV